MALTKVSYSMIQGAPVNVKDYGAVGDGVADDTVAIQAALDYAATLGSATVYFPPATSYKLNSGISIDTSTTIVNFNGNKLDFSGMSSGNAITITRSNPDGNIQNTLNHVHTVSNGFLVGAGVSNTNICAFYFNDAGNFISGGIVSYMGVVNFGKDVYFGDGAFCIEFHHCNFTQTTGTPTTYSINVPSGTSNSGERLSFIGCMWNNRDLVLLHNNVNANTFFVNCSFDYSNTRVMTINGGAVFITASHIEQSSDADTWFWVGSNANAKLSLSQCDVINQQASPKTYAYFYSDAVCTSHGVTVNDCRMSGVNKPAILVSGTGRTVVANGKFDTVFGNPPISTHQNLLAYPGFENANYTAEWTLTSGAIRSNAQARTGSWSLSLPASSGVTPVASTTFPCLSTQSVSGEFWYIVSNITGSSGTLYGTIAYVDKGGNNLFGGQIFAITADVATWTRIPFTTQVITPPGTAAIKLVVTLFGVASGTPTAYLDDFILNVT